MKNEAFGRGELSLQSFFAEGFDWVSYAREVAIENGCPRFPRNLLKIAEQHGVKEEQAAKLYIAEHLPINFWWGWILNQSQKLNRQLYEELVTYQDAVPIGEQFDDESVSDEYRQGIRRGLATDAVFLTVKSLVSRLQSPNVAKSFVQFEHGKVSVLSLVDDSIVHSHSSQEFFEMLKTLLDRDFSES